MREKRFYFSNQDCQAGLIILSVEESHHLKNVLRLKVGDEIILFNGQGVEYQGIIGTLGKKVQVRRGEKLRERLPRKASIALIQALPKKKKMELIIQKACELNVEEIYPVVSERSVVQVDSKEEEKNVSRWERIAVQACKQSGLDWMPEILAPTSLKAFAGKVSGFTAVIMPHTGADLPKMSELIKVYKDQGLFEEEVSVPPRIAILIGPEGGFSNEEATFLKQQGTDLVNLGDLVLRTETAAIVSIALVKYGLGMC